MTRSVILRAVSAANSPKDLRRAKESALRSFALLRLTLVAVLLAGCASSSSKPAGPEPELLIRQLSNIPDAARNITGRISVQYALSVRNSMPTAIQLQRIEVQSIGYGAYTLPVTTVPFDLVIDPGQTRTVSFWGAAVIDRETIMGANGPVTLRTVADFKASGGPIRTTVVQQVHETGFSD